MMYLMRSVAGHLTIFLTRTRGPFWSIRPARILLPAVLGTHTIATLIAVYGLFMTPLGWGWVAFVRGYAIIWALLGDRVTLLTYRILGPFKKTTDVATKKPTDLDADTSPAADAATDNDPGKVTVPASSAALYTDEYTTVGMAHGRLLEKITAALRSRCA